MFSFSFSVTLDQNMWEAFFNGALSKIGAAEGSVRSSELVRTFFISSLYLLIQKCVVLESRIQLSRFVVDSINCNRRASQFAQTGYYSEMVS